MPIESAGISDQGCVREKNEDRILAEDALGLYAVCDGLGGRRCGDVAAELAADVIRRYIQDSRDPMDVSWPYGFDFKMSVAANRLSTAARLANRQVWRRAESSLEYLGMATTIAAVLIDGPSAAVANIGDSRVYLLRGGEMTQLSVDDSFSKVWGRAPGSVLTRAAGTQESSDIHLKEQPLESGDVLVLCSDGLYGSVKPDEIRSVVSACTGLGMPAERLISAAKAAGGPDNVSVVLVRYS